MFVFFRLILVITVLYFAIPQKPAQAGGIPFLFEVGEMITPVEGDIGIKYQGLSIFFIPVLSFDKKYVEHDGNFPMVRYREVYNQEYYRNNSRYSGSLANIWHSIVNWLVGLVVIAAIAINSKGDSSAAT